jgi:hypothetical protein
MRIRETREGWPLLTVETEVNWDSKSTNERGPSLIGSLGLSYRYKRLYPGLAALVSQVQNNFFLTVHNFNLCAPPSPSNLGGGSRAGPPVSEYVSPRIIMRAVTVTLFGTVKVPT